MKSVISNNGNHIIIDNLDITINGNKIEIPTKLKKSMIKGKRIITNYNNSLIVNGFKYNGKSFKFNIISYINQILF